MSAVALAKAELPYTLSRAPLIRLTRSAAARFGNTFQSVSFLTAFWSPVVKPGGEDAIYNGGRSTIHLVYTPGSFSEAFRQLDGNASPLIHQWP